jgi:alkylhydroperoxidase family enzyme
VLDFAWKLTLEQSECTDRDVKELRQAGWTDEAIVDIVGIVGFFNYITRVADALGVELNPEYARQGRD